MSRTRTASIVAAAVLIGVALVWLSVRRESTSASAAARSHPSTGIDEPKAHDAPAAAIDVEQAISRAAVDADEMQPADEDSASDPETKAPSLEVRGTLVLADENGSELPPSDARFQLTVWWGDDDRTVTVEVHAGTWSATVEEASSADGLSVAGLKVGKRDATLENPRDRFPLSIDQAIELRARFPRAAVLRVVDAATGADLVDISLLLPVPFPDDHLRHPGRVVTDRVIASHARSPVDLSDFPRARAGQPYAPLIVGAEGFAWDLVYIDFEHGGERVVPLERSASLDLIVRGVDASARALLRVRSPKFDSPDFEEPLERDGDVFIAGLTPGRYSVRAEVGAWYSAPAVLGEVEVELLADHSVRAELVLRAAAVVEVATAGGRVYVAKEWGFESVSVVADLLDTPLAGFDPYVAFDAQRGESDRAGYDLFLWSRPKMQVGRYELSVFEPPLSIVVELPSGGRDNFELVLPPPVELHVFVVDDVTGEQISTVGLLWNPRRPQGVTDGALETATRDSNLGCYVLRAPEGVIELTVDSLEYAPYDATVELSAGVREHTARLQRACGIVLSTKDGETPVALPKNLPDVTATPPGTGRQSLTQLRLFERKIMVTEPGIYSIAIPKVAGYVQPSLQTIEVVAGRFTEHVVALERERR